MEAANKPASDPDGREKLAVFEKLRASLTQFVGADGFTAVMRRALALARTDIPWLQTVKVSPEGRLEGIEEHAIGEPNYAETATAIIAHLLALLVTFIGAPLTLRLLREVWPDESHRTTIEPEDL